MNRKLAVIVVFAAVLGCTSMVMAQSSGNFTYGSNSGSERCVLNNDNTGKISGGQLCSLGAGPSCTLDADCTAPAVCFNPTGGTGAGECVDNTSGGACTSDSQCTTPGQTCVIPNGATSGSCGAVRNNVCIGGFTVGIKTSSGNGNVFLVRPSAVIGLLTDVSIGSKNSTIIGTSSALAGVDVSVAVSPASGQPNPTLTPNYPVTYDSRFIQISSNLFSVLGTLCTTTTGCYISFNESTVSAHSFDWIASKLQSGQYNVTVNWTSSLGDFGVANSMTCVGPVNLTVQQNKVFSFNSVNSF